MNDNIIGVDEVGRGSLVGSVIICAFRSTNNFFSSYPYTLRDSKKTSKRKRELIFQDLKKYKLNGEIDYSIIFGKKITIEKINIHETVLLSMTKSVRTIHQKNDLIIIDGNFIPIGLKNLNSKSVIKADDKFPQVSAASIIAKCFRDELMCKLHELDNRFSWDQNAGYPTKKHIDSINKYGISTFHRKSYKPISRLINKL